MGAFPKEPVQASSRAQGRRAQPERVEERNSTSDSGVLGARGCRAAVPKHGGLSRPAPCSHSQTGSAWGDDHTGVLTRDRKCLSRQHFPPWSLRLNHPDCIFQTAGNKSYAEKSEKACMPLQDGESQDFHFKNCFQWSWSPNSKFKFKGSERGQGGWNGGKAKIRGPCFGFRAGDFAFHWRLEPCQLL